jgi:hypothetical protein
MIGYFCRTFDGVDCSVVETLEPMACRQLKS